MKWRNNNNKKKTNFVVCFQVTWQSFWRKWLYNISSKASNAAVCSLCAWQNIAGWECRKQLWMLCPWMGCWRNTEKWVHFAVATVLTSEFPPLSFKKSASIWKMDAVVNLIQNYQAYVKLFFSRCQLEAKNTCCSSVLASLKQGKH